MVAIELAIFLAVVVERVSFPIGKYFKIEFSIDKDRVTFPISKYFKTIFRFKTTGIKFPFCIDSQL